MKGIIGKKLGMTQIFEGDGKAVPVTVIAAGPCIVTGVRSNEKHGYRAIQMGYGFINEKRVAELVNSKKKRKKNKIINKPEYGFFKKRELRPLRYIREFRTESVEDYKIGQEIKVTIFSNGDLVDVIGKSKGKGYQGGMKRWGFKGGGASHGSMIHRQPASSGSTDAARTLKGTKKPGRLGFARITAQGLTVVRIDGEKNLMLIRGAVPGAPDGLVFVRQSKKAGAAK